MLTEKIGEVLTKESAILKTVEGFEAKVSGDVAEQMCTTATERVPVGNKIPKISKIAQAAVDCLPIAELNAELVNISRLEEAVKKLKNIPGFLFENGAFDQVLKYARKGSDPKYLSNLRGAMYEIETALNLIEKGEIVEGMGIKILGSEGWREIDIITKKRFIECKNIDWSKFVGKNMNDAQSKFVIARNLANECGKSYAIYSKNVPANWKAWLANKQIELIEGVL